MYTHENFAADTTRHFAFLESDYRMRREPLHSAGAGAWIAYSNADVKVIVELEVGGSCGVSVVDLRHVKRDPMERGEFDLDEIIALAAQRPQRRQEPRSLSEAVARAAETLRTLGPSVLNGDFAALHARQRKLVEAVRRNNPLASN